MRVRLSAIAALVTTLAACGGGGGPGGLAYAVPASASATYAMGDTLIVDIDAMGQSLQMSQSSTSTMTAAFARSGSGVEVTLSVDDWAARMSQPMGAPVTANESGIEGPMVFSMDAMGNVTPGSMPEVSGNAALLFSPLSTVYSFFPGLPGGSVAAGDMWTDTVSFAGAEGEGEIDATMIFEYTAMGDTMVDGRSLMKIDVMGTSASDLSANMQGMEVFQSMTADIDGYILWDSATGVMFERMHTIEGQGTLEVAVAPQPLSMRARGTSRARIAN